jgi:hypothetical protein
MLWIRKENRVLLEKNRKKAGKKEYKFFTVETETKFEK